MDCWQNKLLLDLKGDMDNAKMAWASGSVKRKAQAELAPSFASFKLVQSVMLCLVKGHRNRDI